jgi:hypothetical protein
MLFSDGYGQPQQIGDNKKCNMDAVVRRESHRPLEHVHGFTWSHWMPPSGECLVVSPQRPSWSTNSLKQH